MTLLFPPQSQTGYRWIITALPTDFSVNGTVNRNDTVSGAGFGGGALITIQQMIVRSEEDIRKISQELYNLIQSGSRAQGHFTTA